MWIVFFSKSIFLLRCQSCNWWRIRKRSLSYLWDFNFGSMEFFPKILTMHNFSRPFSCHHAWQNIADNFNPGRQEFLSTVFFHKVELELTLLLQLYTLFLIIFSAIFVFSQLLQSLPITFLTHSRFFVIKLRLDKGQFYVNPQKNFWLSIVALSCSFLQLFNQ